MLDPEVAEAGRCATGADWDAMFPTSAAGQQEAKLLCYGCPIRLECAADALNNRTEHGVWGGLTENERRKLLRRRPDITDWLPFLTAAA